MSISIGQLAYYNIFRKAFIFFKYLSDNIVNKEYKLILASLSYLLIRKSHPKDVIAKTNIGTFYLRAESIDFITVNSAYEYPVMNVIVSELRDSDLFLDIGANIGTYSVLAGSNDVKTLAFEPIKSNYESLSKNIQLNKLEQFIDVFNFGLDTCSRIEEFNFFIRNPGASSLYNIEFNSKGEKVKVELKVFDELKNTYIQNCKSPLIKIDVEGMELNVIEGMKQFIKSKESIKFILESKHTGEQKIKDKFLSLGNFSFKRIDPFNLLVIKTN